MKTAKISARHTYNKCINELQEYHYIKYVPSSDALSGSSVFLNPLQLKIKERVITKKLFENRKCHAWKMMLQC